MNTELMLSGEENLNNFSLEQLAILQEKIMNERMKKIENKVKEAFDKVEKLEERQDRQLEVAINQMRVKEPKYGYVSQSDFGRFFDIPISSHRIGKLLKVVGLAKKSCATTTPYFELIPKYAQVTSYDNYSATKWNYSECVKKIDSWLTSVGLLESFYSCKTKSEREQFIDDIFNRYST